MSSSAPLNHHRIARVYACPSIFATSRQAGAGPVATAGRFAPFRQTFEGGQ